MSGQNKAQSSLFSDEDAEKPKYSVETFAQRTIDEYEKSPEEPKSALEKVKDFVTESSSKVVKTFKESSLVKKAIVFAGVGALVWLGVKLIKKAAIAVKNGFKEVFNISGWFEKKTRDLKMKTAEKFLKTTLLATLGTVLGAALTGTVYGAIKGKLGLGEFLKAFNNEGLKGVGKLLLEKQQNGLINLGKDLWNTVAGPLGLPKYDQIKKTVTTIKEKVDEGLEKAGEVKGKVEEGVEWLKDTINFTVVRDNILSWFKNHNIKPPDELKNITLAQAAKDLGITDEKNNLWQKCVEYGAYGGGALLLLRWLTWKKVAINAALYLLLIKEGKDSWGGQLLDELTSKIDIAKDNLLNKVKDIPGADWLIEDSFAEFSLRDYINRLLDWAGKHPAQALLGMNGLWICRALILRTLKILKSLARTAIKHYKITAAIGIPLFFNRRDFINRFVKIIYDIPNLEQIDEFVGPPTPEELLIQEEKEKQEIEQKEGFVGPPAPEKLLIQKVQEKQKKIEAALETRRLIDSVAYVDRSKPETFTDKLSKQIPEWWNSLIESPYYALTQKESVKKAYKEGELAFGFDKTGRVFAFIAGFSAPYQLEKISLRSFQTAYKAFDSKEKDIGLPLLVGGVEMFVFGSMSYHGFKAYVNLYRSGESVHRIRRLAKGIFWPGSKEWMFVFRSSKDGIPLVQRYMKLSKANRIGRSRTHIQNILKEIGKTKLNSKEIMRLGNRIKESLGLGVSYSSLKGSANETMFKHSFDYEYRRNLKSVEALADRIISEGAIMNNKSKKNIENLCKEIDTALAKYETLLSKAIRKAPLLRSKPLDKKLESDIERSITDRKGYIEKGTGSVIDNFTSKEIETFYKSKQANIKKLKTSLDLASNHVEKGKILTELTAELRHADGAIEKQFAILQDEMAKSKLPREEIFKKVKAFEETWIKPHQKLKVDTFKKINKVWKNIRGKLKRTDIEIHADINKELKHLKKMNKKNVVTRLVEVYETKGKKVQVGKYAICSLLLTSVMALRANEIKKENPKAELSDILLELGPEAAQIVYEMLTPFGLADFDIMISGEQRVAGLISGKERKVEGALYRYILPGLFGAIGLVADSVTVLSGGTLVPVAIAARGLKLLKMGVKGEKILKLMPRIISVVEKVGLKNAYKWTKEFIDNGGKTLTRLQTANKYIGRAGLGTSASIIIGGVTYGLIYDKSESFDLDHELLADKSDLETQEVVKAINTGKESAKLKQLEFKTALP